MRYSLLWAREHQLACPVTKERAQLILELIEDPENQYLWGAVPEYHEGGDQEVENCTCGAVEG